MDLQKIKNNWDSAYGTQMQYMWNYFNLTDVPVNSRIAISAEKQATHTNTHVDYFKDIIELKVGYMGQKINWETTDENISDLLKDFSRTNNLDILNSQSIRWSSIQGLSHRLCYTENGIFKIKNIKGDQVVYEYDHTPFEPTRAFYYYSAADLEGKIIDYCDVYDAINVSYYRKSGKYELINTQPHNFQEVPIIPILNNEEYFGDCERSIKLMDDYDAVISDNTAEIKAIRLAYLKLWGNLYTGTDDEGTPIDPNTWLKQTGTLLFGMDEDGKPYGDAQFLEKNLNDTAVENLLNRQRTHIYETSGSIDLKEVSQSERVFSIKAQMMRLENTCKVTELYMKAMLNKMINLWIYWMQEFDNITINSLDIDWNFQRTFPRDLEAESRTISTLTPIVGLETALKEVGWDNSIEIAEKAKQDLEDQFNKDITNDI